MKYRFLEHTADVKFQAFGKDMNEAFENAAIALFNAMYKGKVTKKINKKIKVQGKDNESLLYNFLEELLFLLDSENFFLSDVKVEINKNGNSLTAELYGDNASNYEISLQVKAITYHDMIVEKKGKKWVTQVVVDV